MSDRDRFEKLCRFMGLASILFILAIPTVHVLAWSGSSVTYIANNAARLAIEATDTSLHTRAIGFLISMVPHLALIYGLVRLRKMFLMFSFGQIFTQEAARHLRIFASMVLLYVLLQIANDAPLDAFLTWQNGPGNRYISIGIRGHDVQAAFLGILFYIIAWTLGEGQRLADENKSFI